MIYCKRNFVMAYNYLEWKSARGTDDMTFRHGLIPTNPAYDTGGMFIGNRLRDPNNVTINLNGSGIVMNGNIVEGGGVGLIMLSAGIINTPLHDAAEHAQLIENHNFTYVEVGQHGTGDTIGNETSDPTTGRNGWPKNIRIYKGDSDWNPLDPGRPGWSDRYVDGDGRQLRHWQRGQGDADYGRRAGERWLRDDAMMRVAGG